MEEQQRWLQVADPAAAPDKKTPYDSRTQEKLLEEMKCLRIASRNIREEMTDTIETLLTQEEDTLKQSTTIEENEYGKEDMDNEDDTVGPDKVEGM